MRTRVHINLDVGDLARSQTFYEALFGQAASKVRTDYANFRLDEPALHLALVHRPAHRRVDTDQHFGIELFDAADLDAWRQRVAHLTPRVEEQVTCCYALADKFWVTDPDGNEWEFWVRAADAESMHESVAPADAAACCSPTSHTTREATPPTPCCES